MKVSVYFWSGNFDKFNTVSTVTFLKPHVLHGGMCCHNCLCGNCRKPKITP